jgi:hypothetical protein
MSGFKAAVNIKSSGAGMKTIFFHLNDTYSGGPEFGFVFDSSNAYSPMYFYWTTNANCGGNPELGLNSFCTSTQCTPTPGQWGEPTCGSPVNNVFENAYVDSTGTQHQVGTDSHSIPLVGAYDQDLVYLAYLYQVSGGEVWFHVEVQTPDGTPFRGMIYELNPNAMGFGVWYPTSELYRETNPGYVSIVVQPYVPLSHGTAMTVGAVYYSSRSDQDN